LFGLQLNIYEYSTDMKGATLQVIGIERGNGTTLTRIHNITAVNTNQVSTSYTQVFFYPTVIPKFYFIQ